MILGVEVRKSLLQSELASGAVPARVLSEAVDHLYDQDGEAMLGEMIKLTRSALHEAAT